MIATDSEIDAYVARVLKTMSPPETCCLFDESLGPYVASLLRCADIQEKEQVKSISEFDSLLELLEDQCNMDKEKASDCVLLIADAVITHVLPFSERTTTIATTTSRMRRGRSNSFPLYSQQGGGLDCFRSSVSSAILESMVTVTEIPSTETTLANYNYLELGRTDSSGAISASAGGPSPLKLDNLIPMDLMGELDDPSPTYSSSSTSALHMFRCQHFLKTHEDRDTTSTTGTSSFFEQSKNEAQTNTNVVARSTSQHDNDFPPLGTSSEAFPPLGASIGKPKKVKIRSSKKSSNSDGKTQQHSNSNKDLAATLFRPARPRQNSIESEEATSRSRGSSNASASMMAMTNTFDESGGVSDSSVRTNLHRKSSHGYSNGTNNSLYFQQQLNSCVEILLSMNQELSEEAASAAGLMANTDFNLAQHIIDSAIKAPPICRHMLHEGCYRSDCTFSHDVDGHTCLFWLRGRCGKGNACKFFHGFHEKLLDGIDISEYNSQQQQNNIIASSPGNAHVQWCPPGLPSKSANKPPIIDGGLGGTSYPLLSSSWQATPSSLEGPFGSSGKSNIKSSAAETTTTQFTFANIASKGYEKKRFVEAASSPTFSSNAKPIPTVRIPQDLWSPHENRDPSVFYIDDPLERYKKVAASVKRSDVIDLHFQSIKTFLIVLETILPMKLNNTDTRIRQVWIVTGTGHHVGPKTHQKGGGALELAVIEWLVDKNYNFSRGKDRNGLGGALLVNR
eukprot:CAMPEP_0168200264 /NCGR_PEP_ID=MMETSP0139_2-20121125/22944_1 /TAXON_ID=44445 /ORGANISM="Pseudo-nitzschia australis, Strain 10249 10 AB" /LENGTH=735 /DNA_ID=CAMNT_0008125469 /DNA_START=732 /DNA_END=2942 /DNA_ORIENTATION=-